MASHSAERCGTLLVQTHWSPARYDGPKYSAARPREWTQQQLAGDLLQRAFGGSAASLMLGALSAHRASPEELAELRQFLAEYEKGKP